jgi:uncharacterized protein (DUF2147 family)
MTRTIQILAMAAFAALSIAPALAADLSPVGQWEVTTGEARYKVTACGASGEALCAKLIWLRPDQRTDDKLALLNTYVVKGAEAVDASHWTGNVTFEGHSYDGKVTLVSKNFMKMQGCSGILCQTYEFTRL